MATTINALPYTINVSGRYIINSNLVFANAGPFIGIDVTISDVDIDLGNYSLTINSGNPGSLIRLAEGVKCVSIHHGTLKGSVPVDNTTDTDLDGIRIEGACNVHVYNVCFQDLRHGVWLPADYDNYHLKVECCQFKDIFSREFISFPDEYVTLEWFGVSIGGFRIRGLHVEKCDFVYDEAGGPFPLYSSIALNGFDYAPEVDYNGFADNGIIRDCNLTNCGLGIAWWPEGNTHGSLTIDGCNFLQTAGENFFLTMIQLCCAAPDCVCRSLQVRNCNFQAKNQTPDWAEGIAIPSGHSVIIDNCTFSLPFNIVDNGYLGGSITIGNGAEGSVVENCKIKCCTFQGETQRHVAAWKTKALLVEDCQFMNGCGNAVLLSNGENLGLENLATQATLKHNVFANNHGNGVKIETGASQAILIDNTFTKCGHGVDIDTETDLPLLKNNTFYRNGVDIVGNAIQVNNTHSSREEPDPCSEIQPLNNKKIRSVYTHDSVICDMTIKQIVQCFKNHKLLSNQ